MSDYTPEEKARIAAEARAEEEARLVRPMEPQRGNRRSRRIQKSIFRKTKREERKS
ncbi:MAG: hypothetical protein IPK75_12550 [Acidobacteria bacterium]|nr:hypothetical protein [Acidobacteriota bacterium]